MAKIGVFAAITDTQNRVLLVKPNYGPRRWTFPGGGLEPNESPVEGAKREVFEETGYIVEIENIVSVYSAPAKDELVLLFRASIMDQTPWEPNNEIECIQFFSKDDLPLEIHPWNLQRIADVYNNLTSSFRVFQGLP